MDSDPESHGAAANECVLLWDDLTLWLRRNIGSKGKTCRRAEEVFCCPYYLEACCSVGTVTVRVQLPEEDIIIMRCLCS